MVAPTIKTLLWAAMMVAVLGVGASDARSEGARFSGAYLRYVCGVDGEGKEAVRGGHAACQAYISGVVDYHNLMLSMKMAPEVRFCLPVNTSMNRLHAVVLAYLNKNPQHDTFVAAPAVVMALYESFPCGGKKKK